MQPPNQGALPCTSDPSAIATICVNPQTVLKEQQHHLHLTEEEEEAESELRSEPAAPSTYLLSGTPAPAMQVLLQVC